MLADRLPDRDAAALLLGVSPDADATSVRRAFRAWAALSHPDHGGDARHFRALCQARDTLLVPARSSAVVPVRPRRTWGQVLVRPGALTAVLLMLTLTAAIAMVLAGAQGQTPWNLVPAALASAAWCVAVSKVVLRSPDHGHVIVTRSLAWGVAMCGQLALGVVAGIALIEALPLLAVPFVAVIAAVNPAAGLRRGVPG